jgi:hypothetical protein
LFIAAGNIARAGSYDSGTQVGTVTASSITEASGVAVSRANSNVLWTHNDHNSTDSTARIFALSTTGSLRATYTLSGVTADDTEDIAVGPGPSAGVSYLYLGDIGDNSSSRTSISVYRVPEPIVGSGGALGGVDTITLAYPAADGAHDAETLMVDPLSADIYVLTKSTTHTRLYRVAAPQTLSGTTTMQYLENVDVVTKATGGDISLSGAKIIVRNDTEAYEWTRSPGQTIAAALAGTPQTIPLQTELQGEAIGYSSSPAGFYSMSEGTNQPLYFYAAVPEPTTLGVLSLTLTLLLRRPERLS